MFVQVPLRGKSQTHKTQLGPAENMERSYDSSLKPIENEERSHDPDKVDTISDPPNESIDTEEQEQPAKG